MKWLFNNIKISLFYSFILFFYYICNYGNVDLNKFYLDYDYKTASNKYLNVVYNNKITTKKCNCTVCFVHNLLSYPFNITYKFCYIKLCIVCNFY